MLAKVYSCANIGLDSVLIEVEVDIASMGLPAFTIVGLPEKSVEEAKERVRSAIKNSGADFPAKRITVNLAPALIPKEGTHFDLPIALGILIASGQLEANLDTTLVIGELALNGSLRRVTGALPMIFLAKQKQLQIVFVPLSNAAEASIVKSLHNDTDTQNLHIFPADNLLAIYSHLTKQCLLNEAQFKTTDVQTDDWEIDFKDIKGQEQAKRALEIAAAGGHNISMQGPPGSGKTMLARALASILPALTTTESLEVTKIFSICGMLEDNQTLVTRRPFRTPHHTVSQIGLIGGGSKPKPGEISLAHRGVLFLDEFPQFTKACIEALRAPLEDGKTTIVRAAQSLTFPSKFLLVTAQNPCPCGFVNDDTKTCTCSPTQISQYQKRISGPILDRIDIHIIVPKVATNTLTNQEKQTEDSSSVRERVQKARDIQLARFAGTDRQCNAEMQSKDIKVFCNVDDETKTLLQSAVMKMNLSARAYHRVLKVARTIADLDGTEDIECAHVAEALAYRHRSI